MSKFSGKCDLYDAIQIYGDAEAFIKDHDIYVGINILPLRVTKPEDLIPYYPRLETVANGRRICISEESYVDEEEREILEFDLEAAISYWKKKKRRKLPCTAEDIANHIAWGFSPIRKHQQEIARRVIEKGQNADIKGIHIDTSDYYREKLYDVMLQYGYKESTAYIWCFGYDRYYQRNS